MSTNILALMDSNSLVVVSSPHSMAAASLAEWRASHAAVRDAFTLAPSCIICLNDSHWWMICHLGALLSLSVCALVAWTGTRFICLSTPRWMLQISRFSFLWFIFVFITWNYEIVCSLSPSSLISCWFIIEVLAASTFDWYLLSLSQLAGVEYRWVSEVLSWLFLATLTLSHLVSASKTKFRINIQQNVLFWHTKGLEWKGLSTLLISVCLATTWSHYHFNWYGITGVWSKKK